MTNVDPKEESRPKYIYRREIIVGMLHAALETSDFRFARQAALSWLAAFPGDMEVSLLQAQAVIAEGKPSLAISILEPVHIRDPFYQEACTLLAWACRDVDPARSAKARTSAYVLGDLHQFDGVSVEEWGPPLRAAYQSLLASQYANALEQVEAVLNGQTDLLLAQVIHLMIIRKTRNPSEIALLAERYAARWLDCIPINLSLAEAYMDLGKEPEAVRLIHLSASGDSTGRVARRMWGVHHPYQGLWSDDMVIYFDQPIPSGVAGRMGWNRLAAGEPIAPPDAHPNPDETVLVDNQAKQNQMEGEFELDPFLAVLAAHKNRSAKEAESDGSTPADPACSLDGAAAVDREELHEEVAQVEEQVVPAAEEPAPTTGVSAAPEQDPKKAAEAIAVKMKVEKELEGLAKKLKRSSLARSDGRYPVYVILSSREGLEKKFGPQTAGVIDVELRRLEGTIGQRKGWQAMVYYPDHAGSTGQYGMTPVNASDPWKIKNALTDLDAALDKRGEMIGALLIVGGDEVLPFHRLPNPADDSDETIISDSPYGALDSNYFVPEWPVGRLPGEKGSDAGALLEQIRQVQRFHLLRRQTNPGLGLEWLNMFKRLFERISFRKKYPSFGYTAAVWRRSSLAVFRPIGAPHTVVASPPVFSGKLNADRVTGSNLGYYNLHGLEDSSSWYGQKDPLEQGNTPDYPVALTPDDLHRNGKSPKFIFSEACYGGHVFGKSEKESLALKFLSLGALGVVASTGIAYGSINTPLIAADLLGNFFWQSLKSGHTAGEALMQAKVGLVREMTHRQGYLDGEDQKTLISFVLYGDPLASYEGFRILNKAVHRYKDHPKVARVTDEHEETLSPSKVPPEVLKGVKQVVSEYLPGADVAGIHFCRVNLNGKKSDDGQAGVSNSQVKTNPGGRMVVTVSKQVSDAMHIHRHYMRVTLDDSGQPLKVALSR